MSTPDRFICALCLVWLLTLEVRLMRADSTGAAIHQTVTVRVCGINGDPCCGCGTRPPAPLQGMNGARLPACHKAEAHRAGGH